jgi:biopolymer transport protein ExbD
MKRKAPSTTGLEAAPDIMLLTMAGLMVAVVWLASHARETTLPPLDLPEAEAARLGTETPAALHVTLRPAPSGTTEVWLESDRVAAGIAGLEAALAAGRADAITLRADAATPWSDVLAAMGIAAKLSLPVSVAALP